MTKDVEHRKFSGIKFEHVLSCTKATGGAKAAKARARTKAHKYQKDGYATRIVEHQDSYDLYIKFKY